MAQVIAFPARRHASAEVDLLEVFGDRIPTRSPSDLDRAVYRSNIETALHVLLGHADRMIALLDDLDGDPDFEPEADGEDGGDREPDLAALVGAISQTRWVGFEQEGVA